MFIKTAFKLFLHKLLQICVDKKCNFSVVKLCSYYYSTFLTVNLQLKVPLNLLLFTVFLPKTVKTPLPMATIQKILFAPIAAAVVVAVVIAAAAAAAAALTLVDM